MGNTFRNMVTSKRGRGGKGRKNQEGRGPQQRGGGSGTGTMQRVPVLCQGGPVKADRARGEEQDLEGIRKLWLLLCTGP